MGKFEIWQDFQCIHEEDGYEVESTQDLYGDIIAWWESYITSESYKGEDAEEFLVKIIANWDEETLNGDEEELTIAELLA